MNKLQDYLQKMEATKKAVGAVKGGKFKQKEGTPKVGLNLERVVGNLEFALVVA